LVDGLRQTKRKQSRPTKLALGKRIRVLRQASGLSQEELADRVGIHPTYLSGIERGERNPALENLNAIARGLGVSLSGLFQFSGVNGDR